MQEIYKQIETLDFPKANPADVNKINKSLNQKNVLYLGGISPKFVKIAASTVDTHRQNRICQTYKREEMKYYRLVFILEIFIYKKFIKESLTLFVKKCIYRPRQ